MCQYLTVWEMLRKATAPESEAVKDSSRRHCLTVSGGDSVAECMQSRDAASLTQLKTELAIGEKGQ